MLCNQPRTSVPARVSKKRSMKRITDVTNFLSKSQPQKELEKELLEQAENALDAYMICSIIQQTKPRKGMKIKKQNKDHNIQCL